MNTAAPFGSEFHVGRRAHLLTMRRDDRYARWTFDRFKTVMRLAKPDLTPTIQTDAIWIYGVNVAPGVLTIDLRACWLGTQTRRGRVHRHQH